MAVKAPINVRRLPELAYVTIDIVSYSVADGLRGLARWLDDHPYSTLLGVNFNYAANDDENYITAFIDCVEDNELN